MPHGSDEDFVMHKKELFLGQKVAPSMPENMVNIIHCYRCRPANTKFWLGVFFPRCGVFLGVKEYFLRRGR
jgi:hypothetical protein